jgi:hypothetical protein
MKIIVLNGSPKGDHSITFQYVNFIQKRFPQHELKAVNVSQKIKRIEKDEKTFLGIIDEVRSSDGVLRPPYPHPYISMTTPLITT